MPRSMHGQPGDIVRVVPDMVRMWHGPTQADVCPYGKIESLSGGYVSVRLNGFPREGGQLWLLMPNEYVIVEQAADRLGPPWQA